MEDRGGLVGRDAPAFHEHPLGKGNDLTSLQGVLDARAELLVGHVDAGVGEDP